MPTNETRARPVDALFGDSSPEAPAAPTHVIEPAMPVAHILPPTAPPSFLPPTTSPEQPLARPIAAAPPDPLSVRADPGPPRNLARDNSQYAMYVSDMIRDLYEQVINQLADSPTVSEYCMGILLRAREAFQNGNYPSAEYYAESVDAKLKRSTRSVQASHTFGVWLLWAWLSGMLGLGGFLIGVTYISNLTLFGALVSTELLIAMRVIG